jgi:hypothetical protein
MAKGNHDVRFVPRWQSTDPRPLSSQPLAGFANSAVASKQTIGNSFQKGA